MPAALGRSSEHVSAREMSPHWAIALAYSFGYGLGDSRVAALALLTLTALSGSRSCGVVITKFSAHAVAFRSSPTVFGNAPMSASTSTRIMQMLVLAVPSRFEQSVRLRKN